MPGLLKEKTDIESLILELAFADQLKKTNELLLIEALFNK